MSALLSWHLRPPTHALRRCAGTKRSRSAPRARSCRSRGGPSVAKVVEKRHDLPPLRPIWQSFFCSTSSARPPTLSRWSGCRRDVVPGASPQRQSLTPPSLLLDQVRRRPRDLDEPVLFRLVVAPPCQPPVPFSDLSPLWSPIVAFRTPTL
jgi:hypothetical protein